MKKETHFDSLLRDILSRYGADFAALRDGEKTPADAWEAYQILTPVGDVEWR